MLIIFIRIIKEGAVRKVKKELKSLVAFYKNSLLENGFDIRCLRGTYYKKVIKDFQQRLGHEWIKKYLSLLIKFFHDLKAQGISLYVKHYPHPANLYSSEVINFLDSVNKEKKVKKLVVGEYIPEILFPLFHSIRTNDLERIKKDIEKWRVDYETRNLFATLLHAYKIAGRKEDKMFREIRNLIYQGKQNSN